MITPPIKSHAQYLPKGIRKHLTNCYTDSNPQPPFNTDGYYIFKVVFTNYFYENKQRQSYTDTFKFNVIFYKDGSYVDNAMGSGHMNFEEYAKYLKDNPKRLEWLGRWGIYRVEGDEIIAQSVFDPGYKLQLYKWDLCEKRYKIIDANTLAQTRRECWDGKGKSSSGEFPKDYTPPKYLSGRFVPFADMPAPESWLKKIDYLKCRK